MNDAVDISFWAVCVVAFYGMLRMSSLFPPCPSVLLVSAAEIHTWGIVIYFKYSKTVQYEQRRPYVVLPWKKNRQICAATALLRNWQGNCLCASDPMFGMRHGNCMSPVPLSREAFITKYESIMSVLGLSGYTGHSFRRGGATHALSCGVPTEVIMAQGDWKSMAYLDYLDTSDVKLRAESLSSML